MSAWVSMGRRLPRAVDGGKMRLLTFADFAGRLGEAYDILVGGGRLPVVLDEAQPLPGSPREGGGFRLVFRGPLQPIVAQGTYPIQRGSETHEIFIVPIAQVPAGTRYEAIFM
jgi:hypothetical protein